MKNRIKGVDLITDLVNDVNDIHKFLTSIILDYLNKI